MGKTKVFCVESEEEGIEFMGLLVAAAIAIMLLILCLMPPPKKRRCLVHATYRR